MDSPRIHEPQSLFPCSSRRSRRSNDSNSPEFEFWMVRNPSFPQPNLLSADELFVDGVLLPLHLLSQKPSVPHPQPDPEPPNKEPGEQEPGPGPGLGPELIHVTTESANGLSTSKRWTDIFKKGDKKATAKSTEDNKDKDREKEKEKKREKKSQSGVSSAELNINIWPFSRSRSAGNNGTRPRFVPGAPGTRKVSSAPCSRSNSAGESKSRKWPSSPGRPGVHLARSSPIWQVKRGGSGLKSSEAVTKTGEKGISKKEVTETRSSKSKSTGNGSNDGAAGGNGNGNGKVRVLNLNVNVPMCIGYRHHLSCRSDENSTLGVVGVGSNKSNNNNGGGGGGGGGGGAGAGAGGGAAHVSSSGNLFNLRSLFTKKVY